MKKITNIKQAWELLGNLYETADQSGLPEDMWANSGICMTVEDAMYLDSYGGPAISAALWAAVEQDVLERMQMQMDQFMDLQIHLQYDICGFEWMVEEDAVRLGPFGKDFGTRALWCYMMADAPDNLGDTDPRDPCENWVRNQY